MKPTISQLLQVMKFVTWFFFGALCLKTGAMLYSYLLSITVQPSASSNFYLELNLSGLRRFSYLHYCVVGLMVVTIYALNAFLLFKVGRIFVILKQQTPFYPVLGNLLGVLSLLGLVIGIVRIAATGYSHWLFNSGAPIGSLTEYTCGGLTWMYFAGVLFIVSLFLRQQQTRT